MIITIISSQTIEKCVGSLYETDFSSDAQSYCCNLCLQREYSEGLYQLVVISHPAPANSVTPFLCRELFGWTLSQGET